MNKNYITVVEYNGIHERVNDNYISVLEREEDQDESNKIIYNDNRGDNESILVQIPLEVVCT